MSLSSIQALVSKELKEVDQLILSNLSSSVTLINDIGQHLILSGGKRLRPLIVLLSAKAFDYQGRRHLQLATIIEFFHTSSLLHDDVVDNSQLRRGKKTANNIWGSKASVLVGDYIFSKAFQMLATIDHAPVLSILAQASHTITQGEVEQLMNCHNPNLAESHYLKIIRCKTAALFSAASQMGPVLTQASQHEIDAMQDFGQHLGCAFQMIDDALDYQSSAETMGKNIGEDLAEGKVTLPVLYALSQTDTKTRSQLKAAIEDGDQALDGMVEAIKACGAIEYTCQRAEKEINSAVTALLSIKASPYRDALESLAVFNLERTY